MATHAKHHTENKLGLGALLFLGALGLGIVYASGHIQAHAIHDAAHDMRHALGFPCH